MPNKALSEFKGNQNWIKVTGEFITFLKGALHYSDFLQEVVPDIAWGRHTRVVLDIGCGVANFGGYLFDKEVLTMSFAPKDDQESQIQFALERGIPAISAVMGTQRLPFPSRVFDLVHCVRCKVPWHKDGGILLLEVNRMLRPGGYFIWSATPVYGTLEEDVQAWKEMSALTVAMCWELVSIKKDKPNMMGVAIYHKPDSNECYNVVKRHQPPMCRPDDDPNFAWYVPLQTCIHMMPMGEMERGSHWPEEWPLRVQKPPYWLNQTQTGIYGKPAPLDFTQDYEHWTRVITKTYMNNLGIDWSNVRNVMDMRAVYGGFAAALKDANLWVLNVVNVDSPHDTLPTIFERGLIGIYHDWCESFSTYPRTYDLLHADHLFSKVKERCRIKGLMAETDRILRPGGILIARDEPHMISELDKLLRSLNWEFNITLINKQEAMISGRKSLWRPNTYTE
ncbi:putative S-adenosyl-L-methionine-dependent methyltransferase [Helianthus annuus]|nr:putative S-adenosyl-L-methionine-dependent methyltransferase [Helianthus annuus]